MQALVAWYRCCTIPATRALDSRELQRPPTVDRRPPTVDSRRSHWHSDMEKYCRPRIRVSTVCLVAIWPTMLSACMTKATNAASRPRSVSTTATSLPVEHGGSERHLDSSKSRVIGRVTIEGNHAFSDRIIVAGLATRPPRGLLSRSRAAFDPLALRMDEERIENFYRERGYLSARVEDVVVRPGDGNSVDVSFVVDEGAGATRIATVTIIVNAPLQRGVDAAGLRRMTGLETGTILVYSQYLGARHRLHAALVETGYLHARVKGSVLVDRDARVANIRFDLDPGPLVRFGAVSVEGRDVVPASSIAARIAWKQGEVFTPDALGRTQTNLYRLGVFSSVVLDFPDEAGAATLPITIKLALARQHELRLGGGIVVDRSRADVQARCRYVVRNWQAPLLTLSLDARPGYTLLPGHTLRRGFSGELLAAIRKDDFLVPLLGFSLAGAYELRVLELFSTVGPRGDLSLVRSFLRQRLTISAGWELSYFSIVEGVPGIAAAIGAQESYRLGSYRQELLFDGRDSRSDPGLAMLARLSLEEAGRLAAGRADYVKMTPEIHGYVPLSGRLLAAGYLRMGRVLDTSWERVPITQRYFGGGATGHRGFGYRRLSPMVELDDGRLVPVGGTTLVEASGELRTRLMRMGGQWIGLTFFVDAGDVTQHSAQLDLPRLHWATGLGLTYETIAGPLRFDVGIRLNRLERERSGQVELNPDPGRRFALHFSLGEPF
ncbi:MAG: BamA/TamA family outer membrane protein [Pseudomonadota bacterium]